MSSMNYNIYKPKEAPKKFFTYQNIFWTFFALSIIYIFSRYFVHDATIYRSLAEERMLAEAGFTYSGFIKFIGSQKFSLICEFIGRICIPMAIFCIFLCIYNGKLNLWPVLFVIIFAEGFYHYFNFKQFYFGEFSEVFMVLLSIPFFYAWTMVKRNGKAWAYRLLLTFSLLFISIFLGVNYAISLSIYIISLAYFDPVRSSQAIFGAISMFPQGSSVLANLFVYFYDEDFDRKRTNSYWLLFLPIFTIIIFILRNKILG